jgi:hypothetical protein
MIIHSETGGGAETIRESWTYHQVVALVAYGSTEVVGTAELLTGGLPRDNQGENPRQSG